MPPIPPTLRLSVQKNILQKLRLFIAATSLFAFFTLELLAQERNIDQLSFQELVPPNDSPLSQINEILQGPQGFTWIASTRGALRYDGYGIKSYVKEQGNPNSLINNSVWTLHLDKQNRLWLGTHRGVSRYEQRSDSFRNYVLNHDDIDNNQTNRCNAIVEDSQGRLFAATEDGIVYKYDPRGDEFIPLNRATRFGVIKSMAVQANGTIWLGCDGVAFSFHPDSLEIRKFTQGFETPHGASVNFLYSTCLVNEEQIWFGTAYSGIVALNPTTGEAVSLPSRRAYEQRVRRIKHQGKDSIWACRRDGITVYDVHTLERKTEYNSSGKAGSLPSASISSILVDDQQNVWVGTFKQGIYLSTNNKAFRTYTPKAEDLGAGVESIISQVMIDAQDRHWYGFVAGGIKVTDANQELLFSLKPDPDDPRGLGDQTVYDIIQTTDGAIWVATYNSGLHKFDESTRSFTRYKHEAQNADSLSGNDIRGIAEDRDGHLWLAIKGYGFTRFDPTTGKAKNYYIDPLNPEASILNKWPSDIEIGPSEKVFIATPDGLSVFDPKENRFENYRPNKTKKNSLIGTYCLDLFRDSNGQIWIGTNNGISLFNDQKKTFTNYQVSDGMPSNQVLAIHEDLNGNIWAGTDNGLAKINLQTGKIKSYDTLDGLIYNGFLPDSVFRRNDGQLYFGQKRGVTLFQPSEITENTTPPDVFITDIKVLFKSLSSEKNSDDSNENKFYPGASIIKLDYDKKAVTIEYVAKNYIQTPKNQYAYRLIGFDNDWVHVGTRREAHYTNLNPGNYTFQVKAQNNDGYWNEEGTKIDIVITPPFWKRPEFYTIFILATLGSIFLFIRMREKHLIQEREKLERIVAKRTATISQQNTKLEEQKDNLAEHRSKLEEEVAARTAEYLAAKVRAEESDRLKSSFLANLSHEIRTPLNAVVGFSNLLSAGGCDKEEIDEFAEIIDDNSKSLLRLIDDILDFSLIESNQITIYEKPFVFNDFFESIGSAHSLVLSETDIEFTWENTVSDEGFIVHSDRQRLKQIIDNLLTNATKFTHSGSIKLEAEISAGNLSMTVADTGKGIKPEHLERIFEHFYRIQEDERMAKRGVGLGLAICKRLAELLDGSLSVESEEGQGSRFTLNLPLHKAESLKASLESKHTRLGNTKPRSFSGKRILVIEDEETNFKLLEASLKKYKVELLWATGGEEGISLFNDKGPFDMVLLDIKLPKMDGFEVHSQLRAISPDSIIVAQTAYSMKEDEIRIRAAGFTDYLSKPISSLQLNDVLNRHLD